MATRAQAEEQIGNKDNHWLAALRAGNISQETYAAHQVGRPEPEATSPASTGIRGGQAGTYDPMAAKMYGPTEQGGGAAPSYPTFDTREKGLSHAPGWHPPSAPMPMGQPPASSPQPGAANTDTPLPGLPTPTPGGKLPAVSAVGAGPSPGREFLRRNEEADKQLGQAMTASSDRIDQRMEALRSGQEANALMVKKAGFTDQANQAELRTAERDANAAANTSQIERERKREILRGQHMDPNKWFKDQGTAGSLLAAIAVGAGAFGAAMPHSNGKNTAMDIINQAVGRDVDAQQADLDQQWKDLDYQGTEDEKRGVRDQFMIARKRQAAEDVHSHANALIAQHMQGVTDQDKITALADLKDQNSQNLADLAKEDAKQRYGVAMQERAQAGAAASAQALKDREMEHRYGAYVDDWHKGKQDAPLLDKVSWLRHALGSGAEARAGKADAASAIQPKSTEWDPTRSIQGTEGFKRRNDQEAHNSLVLTQAHKNGIRDPDKARQVMSAYVINAGDSQATIDMKLAAFNRDYGSGGESVPGAVADE